MARTSAALRRSGFDDLGLRRALDDRMLPVLVAAMAFLAALALAGSAGASALVRHWQEGAASAVTVQVPTPTLALPQAGDRPDETRLDRALAVLRAAPGVGQARPLSDAELTELLRPWLGNAGGSLSLPVPAVIQVRLAGTGPDVAALQTRLETAVPGTLVESHGAWVQRLAVLARSLQACAWLALAVVAAVAAAVVMVGVRTGLLARRESIEIVHGLGATDGYIAGRFAARATLLAAIGGLAGALLAVPVLLALATLAAPFVATPQAEVTGGTAAVVTSGTPAMLKLWLTTLKGLPTELLFGLPLLPLAAAAIGFLTAQATVRSWLRRLP
jgi:cell division transport system permease protein